MRGPPEPVKDGPPSQRPAGRRTGPRERNDAPATRRLTPRRPSAYFYRMPYRRKVLSVAALSPLAAIAAPLSSARADVTADGTNPLRGEDAAPTAPSAPTREVPRATTDLAGELELAGGFRIVRARDLHFGALPFVIEGEGLRFQVDALRRNPSGVSGVYDSNRFSLFVADGATAFTAPTRVRGARALGAALERRVSAGAELPTLATFEERQASHPDAALAIDFDAEPTAAA